jgi:hypothetical protein
MFHTSPSKELKINKNGIAQDCLFFSDEVYKMSEASIYTFEADFNCVRASELHDDEIINQIAEYFNCDLELAESLLDASESEWSQEFDCDGEDSWWLQGKRGECAVKMGYDGCEDEDEQGTVYIVPMFGRESELTLVECE